MAQPVKKVLIVDDEETLTWSMSKSLSKDRDKYGILIANTGKEALETLDNHAVDLVITDIRMPDINGLDLLTTIKEKYPSTEVIIMTAYGSSDIQKEANKRGSLYYIEKPFEIADIRKLILDILWKRRGFEGKVFDLQLTDVIQLNCLCRVTAALKVSREDRRGVIYFSEGEIVHAECDGQVGKAALYTMLGWREGRFDHERGWTPPQRTISENWEHLLVEAMQKSDEHLSPISGSPEIRSASSRPVKADEDPRSEPTVGQMGKEQSMEVAVASISQVAGCEGTMIVSEDGVVLAHDAIGNTAKEGALVAFLAVLSHRLSKIFETGELHRILLGGKKKKVILKEAPYYLEVRLKEGVRFDEVGPSIWKTLNNLRETHGFLGRYPE